MKAAAILVSGAAPPGTRQVPETFCWGKKQLNSPVILTHVHQLLLCYNRISFGRCRKTSLLEMKIIGRKVRHLAMSKKSDTQNAFLGIDVQK
jgi:hypothetical protein